MQTPKDWSENLKKNVITEEMLGAAAYSVNKRAKNCRDKKREYRHRYDQYHNAEQYEAKEEEYYRQKEILLSVVRPVCIHCEHQGFERLRHYDYEPDFFEALARCLPAGTICWSNSYVSGGYRERGWDGWEWYGGTTTYFFDELLLDKEQIRYYLYYALEDHTYHHPIDEKDVEMYREKYGIEVQHIGFLDTSGRDIADLASPAFVKKLIALIQTKQYTYVENPDRQTPTYSDAYKGEGLSEKDAWDNIRGAISFGWSRKLSDHIEGRVSEQRGEMYKTANPVGYEEAKRAIAQAEQKCIVLRYEQKDRELRGQLSTLKKQLAVNEIHKDVLKRENRAELLKRICKAQKSLDKPLKEPKLKKEQSADFVRKFLGKKQAPVQVQDTNDLVEQIVEFLGIPDAISPQVELKMRMEIRKEIEPGIRESHIGWLVSEFAELRRQAESLLDNTH